MIEARHRGSLVFPFVLIVAGALLLLAVTGVLPADAGWRFLQLWPLILIALGVQLVASRALPADSGRLVALAVIGLLAVGALAYAAFGQAVGGGTLRHLSRSAPVAGVTQARLSIATAGANIHIVAADTGEDLYRADVAYAGTAPRVSADGGSVEISGPTGVQFGSTARNDFRITVSSSVPWQIDVSGAGASGTVELTTTPLTSFSMSGVGANLALDLGQASGQVPVSISGVGNTLAVSVPAGTAYDVAATGVGTSGSPSSPGWSGAADRFDIAVSGVGSKVSVEERNS